MDSELYSFGLNDYASRSRHNATEFRRLFSSLSSRADKPFMQEPPPASTMLEVSSLRIYDECMHEQPPPRHSSECSRRSFPAVGAPPSRRHVPLAAPRCRYPSSSPPECSTRPGRGALPGCREECKKWGSWGAVYL